MCSPKCQNETAEITLQITVDTTRRFKTIPRNTPRYSDDTLGHCESVVKEVENQIHVLTLHTLRADHKCDSDRRAEWTITQCTVKAEEQTSFCKWMSKGYHGEVVEFAELSWFFAVLPSSQNWQNSGKWLIWLESYNEPMNICS